VGAYDRNDPFPISAEARERGPHHRVSLADGHVAWLAVRYDEARSLLDDRRLFKNMIPAAVEELLRYDAPVPRSTFRYAIEPETSALSVDVDVLNVGTPSPGSWSGARRARREKGRAKARNLAPCQRARRALEPWGTGTHGQVNVVAP
jgi:hypothetical protein